MTRRTIALALAALALIGATTVPALTWPADVGARTDSPHKPR